LESAYEFSEGLAGVLINGKWGFIDTTGSVAIKPKFRTVWSFSGGVAKVVIDGEIRYIDGKSNYAQQ